jgi:hypothetical protein
MVCSKLERFFAIALISSYPMSELARRESRGRTYAGEDFLSLKLPELGNLLL